MSEYREMQILSGQADLPGPHKSRESLLPNDDHIVAIRDALPWPDSVVLQVHTEQRNRCAANARSATHYAQCYIHMD